MTHDQHERTPDKAEIIPFAPVLQRRRDREAFFRLHGEWINPYRDGVDGLWIGPMNAQVIPLALRAVASA